MKILRVAAVALLCLLSSAPAFPLPDSCNPDGYIHYCGHYCGRCEAYGGCCKTADSYNQYCLEVDGHSGTGCHDGYDDGCCTSDGLF